MIIPRLSDKLFLGPFDIAWPIITLLRLCQ